MIAALYRRIVHAAHTGDRGGWDLDEWDVASEDRPHVARLDTDVPVDAEYHSGYVDADGRQHWLFVRRAPFSAARCSRCPS